MILNETIKNPLNLKINDEEVLCNSVGVEIKYEDLPKGFLDDSLRKCGDLYPEKIKLTFVISPYEFSKIKVYINQNKDEN